MVTCKRCGSSLCAKSGQIRGQLCYRCKACRYQFALTKRHDVDLTLKSFAIVLYAYCGLSMRKIGQLCKMSTVSVLRWIKAAALIVEDTATVNDRSASNVVMIDEMWHFVNEKKLWLWRAIDGVSRRSLGWGLGHRGDATIN